MANTRMKTASWDDWDGPRDGLIAVSDGLSLHLRASGPRRQSGQPVVIFESGLDVGGAGWAAVRRLLDDRIRSYCYDRAGYGRSPPVALGLQRPRNAVNMAAELLDLLEAVGVKPPYLMVAHSYGAIIAREVMAAAGDEAIVGLVLVDANQEDTHCRLLESLEPAMQTLKGQIPGPTTGLAWRVTPGLLADDRNKFTPEELDDLARSASAPAATATSAAERSLVSESSAALAQRHQLEEQALGMHPVTVIRGDAGRDLRRSLANVELPAGDGQARRALETAQDFLSTKFDALDRELQMQQLRLSANCRFVQASGNGHNVMASEPGLVADEVLSVWESSQL